MFKFIFYNVFEIFVVTASIAVVGVLIFAVRHRLKQDAAELAEEEQTTAAQMKVRDVGLVSAGMAQTYGSDGASDTNNTPEKE